MQKTYYPKENEVPNHWYLVDATGMNLGRLATRVARALLGKDKPQFTPGVPMGDYVVIINVEKIEVTGRKLDDKIYYRHTGYPGGLKKITLREQLKRFPSRVLKSAVWGMLPHNRHGRKLLKRLKLYAGADHPHEAQNPKPLP